MRRATIRLASTGGGGTGGGGGGGTDPRFDYCYQVKDAGYGPYYKGKDPEYDWYTDSDSDGIVCGRHGNGVQNSLAAAAVDAPSRWFAVGTSAGPVEP